MKKGIILSVLFVALFTVTTVAQNEKTFTVDTENSQVEWIGKKITSAHNGTIALSDGMLVLANGVLTGGNFTIDMTSIKCTDIENDTKAAKLIGHLKNDDFFSVNQFPTASLIIKSADKIESKASESRKKSISTDLYEVVADLTIKGITQEIAFTTSVVYFNDGSAKASSELSFDRTLFDIHYGADKSLGDRMIYKDVAMSVELSLN